MLLKTYLHVFIIGLTTAGLVACSGEDNTPTPEVTETENPQVEHVWQDQVNTIDKAKAVEGIQAEQFQKQREAIDAQ